VFTPADTELRGTEPQPDSLPDDFFSRASTDTSLNRRELGERWATRLNVQGLAGVESAGNPNIVRLSVLTAGSAEPEALTFDLNDPTSRANLVSRLSAELPPLVRMWLPVQLADVADIYGVVVVRAAADTGLTAGDVITDVDGRLIASVSDFWQRIKEHDQP